MLCCLLAFLSSSYLFLLPPKSLSLEFLVGSKEQGQLIFDMTERPACVGGSEVKGDLNKTFVFS